MKYDAAISLLVMSFAMGLYRGMYLAEHNANLYDILGQTNEIVLLTCICLVAYKRRVEIIGMAAIYCLMSINEFRQTINLENFHVTTSDYFIIYLCVLWYGISLYLFRKSRKTWKS